MKEYQKSQLKMQEDYLKSKHIEYLAKSKIREIPDWPKRGVSFKDITPLLQDREVFSKVIDYIAWPYLGKKIDKVVGIDARGFIFASALAYKLNTGLVIVRKEGKLPWQTVSQKYASEYGSNVIEMHQDAILPEEKVLIIDDVLATGGTMAATIDLVKQLGGQIVAIEFLVELLYLNGRQKLEGFFVNSLVKYDSENEILTTAPLEFEKPTLKIGIIGGSGFYDFFGENAEEIEVGTEYGKPSDKITTGEMFGRGIYFLPRHGKKHNFPPHKIPYKANIKALKNLGVDIIIAPCAVGSLKTEIKSGDFVICDQFINRTTKREDTFFDGPEVAHIEGAFPFCSALRKIAYEQGQKLGLPIHQKGTVVVVEGPRFSTLAESLFFSKMGWDLVNMTLYPEVALAAEAGICYLNISLVTDYDAGVYAAGGAEPVSIEKVLENFKQNNEKLKIFISKIIENIGQKGDCGCKTKSEKAKM